MAFKDYLAAIFEPTILLSFLTAMVGVAASLHYPQPAGSNSAFTLLVIIGAVLAQIAVNFINDYHDYAIGIDKETIKTRFSGGSKHIASGAIKHKHALWLGMFFALVSGLIGLYLAIAVSMILIAFIAVGAISVFFYSRYLSTFPLISEPLVMLAFILVGAGSYIVAHLGTANLGSALFAIVPAGMLSGITLLVNEVPDAEIDKKYGRKHAVIVLNSVKNVAVYYFLLMLVTYMLVIYGIVQGAYGYPFLIVLITLPAALYVANGVAHYQNPGTYERYMAISAASTFFYLLLLAIAFSI